MIYRVVRADEYVQGGGRDFTTGAAHWWFLLGPAHTLCSSQESQYCRLAVAFNPYVSTGDSEYTRSVLRTFASFPSST